MFQMHGMDVQLHSLHKRAMKFLMPISNVDYKQNCCVLLYKQLLLSKCVVMQKIVHGKARQYLKDLMVPSERLHVNGNKRLLPGKIDVFKKSFSFLVPFALNSSSSQIPHGLKYIPKQSISDTQ